MNAHPNCARPTAHDELSVAELVSSETLLRLTGLPLPVCETFLTAFVDMIEDVGDFDGLIVTSHLLIAGRDDRIDAAIGWLARRQHQATTPAVDPRPWSSDDSLDLAWATDSNPSLTFASATAVTAYLFDEVVDPATPRRPADAARLTAAATELMRQGMPGRAASGGAELHRLGARLRSTSLVGMMEV